MHPLYGIREKLERADKNIHNLDAEMSEFIAPLPVIEHGINPIFTDEDRKAWETLQNAHKAGIPPRFSILAGEVIHHLRSCFDHLAWQLSSTEFRATKASSKVEFPIFNDEPDWCTRNTKTGMLTRNEMCGYCRKVQGITSPTALTRIGGLQPYVRPDPLDDFLWIIHDMDRIDKHRELVMTVMIPGASISGNTIMQAVLKQQAGRPSQIIPLIGTAQMNVNVKISLKIAFSEFGKRKEQPVTPSLFQLLNFTRNTIESFAGEFS